MPQFIQKGPQDICRLRQALPSFKPSKVIGTLVVCGGIGALVGLSFHKPAGLEIALLVGGFASWLLLSGVLFVSYVAAASDGTYSITNIPWRKPWTWVLVLITLPWLPCWIISLVRLAMTPKSKRPK